MFLIFFSFSVRTRTRDKYRVVYSERQRFELEKEYVSAHYITIKRKTELADILNLSERQVSHFLSLWDPEYCFPETYRLRKVYRLIGARSWKIFSMIPSYYKIKILVKYRVFSTLGLKGLCCIYKQFMTHNFHEIK